MSENIRYVWEHDTKKLRKEVTRLIKGSEVDTLTVVTPMSCEDFKKENPELHKIMQEKFGGCQR